MFTDHMYFSGAIEMIGILVLLGSFAVSCQVHCLHQVLSLPAPGFQVLLDPLRNLFTPRIRGTSCSLNTRRDVPVFRKYDLFPRGCRAPATGKEN